MIIAIDPGQTGAAVAMTPHGVEDFVLFYRLEFGDVDKGLPQWNVDEFCGFLDRRAHSADKIIVENVHSMPKQGVASTFQFGKNVGIIYGAIGMAGRLNRVALVTPQKWKKHFGLMSTKGNKIEKSAAIPVVKRYFADVPNHSGVADAILIGRYYLETLSE